MKNLDTEDEWEAFGLAGKNIKAFVALDDDTFLASEFNFGGLDPEGMTDLEYSATSGELFASGTLSGRATLSASTFAWTMTVRSKTVSMPVVGRKKKKTLSL
ncbi:MAG: hypothetical protein ACLFQ0_19170 [Cyclobacteriaceae bacterium]